MEQQYDRNLLLGLPRRIFLTTDFISYTTIIPFTALMSYFMIDISGTQTVIYFSAILLLIGAACAVTVVSYRKLFSPILLYFNAALESREVTDREFYLAKKTFFSLSRRRCLEALISWCVLMPAGMLLVVLLFKETLAVEREIGKVIGEVENLKGSINYYSDRVALSDVDVTVSRSGDSTARPSREITRWEWIRRLGIGSLVNSF